MHDSQLLSRARRSAPSTGYDFGAKRDYRRKVWGSILPHLPVSGHLACLPSIEGDEVKLLLGHGVPINRIVVIDKNPAIAATLSRRHPGIKAYGCDVAQAIPRMVKDGVTLAAINLDLCGPVSSKLVSLLRTLAESRVVVDSGFIAVTCLKGRETGESRSLARAFLGAHSVGIDSPDDFAIDTTARSRAAAIVGVLQTPMVQLSTGEWFHRYYYAFLVRQGEYPSGRQRMVWVSAKVHRQPCLCDICTTHVPTYQYPDLVARFGHVELARRNNRIIRAMATVFGPEEVRRAAIRLCNGDEMVCRHVDEVLSQ